MSINTPSGTVNVIEVIQQEHQEIDALLARVADRGNSARSAAFEELALHLAKHEAAEQAVVRPEIAKIDNVEGEHREAEEATADAMLEQLRSMDVDSAEFNTLFDKFRGAVLSHAQHEEAEEHPKLEAHLDADRLEDMGDKFVQAEADAKVTEVVAHSGLLKDVLVHVEDTGGSGRPVVLIHGWPLSGASLKLQSSALHAAGYRVVAYDRRGFGQSDKPMRGYTYDALADDLHSVITELDLHDVTLVGFSMGGGEVARYVTEHGVDRLHSVVFAAAVPPYLLKTDDNPEGPLTKEQAAEMSANLAEDENAFYDEFTTQFFSAGGQLQVTESQRQEALALCHQADKKAALACMAAFGATDFRDDLPNVTVPTLVIHGEGDAIVPFEGSGRRTHEAIPQSELVVLAGAPHGCNVSHADAFNDALLAFLAQ